MARVLVRTRANLSADWDSQDRVIGRILHVGEYLTLDNPLTLVRSCDNPCYQHKGI